MKSLLLLLLCIALSVELAGCGSSSAESTVSETKAGSETTTENQTLTAETETQTQVAETETTAQTESETESLYFKDGTRKAWIKADGNVNVRQKPSTKAAYLGSFRPRQKIKLLSEKKTKKGFYHVYGTDIKSGSKIEGYVSADFVSLDPPEDPKVQLDVVSYLQTDEKWSSLTLGSTKLTMYDKGCACTSLAMSESFIQGKTITPADEAEACVFNSEGELGWPRSYMWYYVEDDSLQFIYNKLHEGIPVLVNYRRYNGSPHWVLVTGYTGNGGTLKAKDFVINDPLPFGRTNLQQFIDEYPKFCKLIYYCKDRALVKGTDEWKKAQKKKKAAAKKAAAKKSGTSSKNSSSTTKKKSSSSSKSSSTAKKNSSSSSKSSSTAKKNSSSSKKSSSKN